MRNVKQIITATVMVLASVLISGTLNASLGSTTGTWDLIRQEIVRKNEPNKPAQSEIAVHTEKPAEPAKPVEPVKTVEPPQTQQVETQTKERVLHFPKDHSIGELYIQDESFIREIRDFRPVDEWQSFAQAKGDVNVPVDKRLKLIIAGNDSGNLSVLDKLKPDDLYTLSISSRSGLSATDYPNHVMLDDKCMPYIIKLTNLKGLELQFTDIDAKGFSLLSNLKSLEYLSITSDTDYATKKLDDKCLAEVSKLQTLEELKIGDNNLTDKGLTYLSGLTSLKRLQIGGGQLTNDGLINLTKLPSLEYLSLFSHNFTDDGLVYLKDIPSLRILDVGASHIWTNEALKHIAKINNLEALNLNWSENITDDGIAFLAELKSLKKLNISSSKVTDKALSYLKNVKTLDYLTLPPRGISDTGLTCIGQMSNLKHLDVSRVLYVDPKLDAGYYTDKGVTELAKCKLLEELTIGSIGMTDEGMSDIAKLTNLKQLNLFGCSNVTNKGMEKLKSLKSLQNLSIYNANITTKGLSSLNELSNLTYLKLNYVRQDNTSTMDISRLTKLENLTLSLYSRRDVQNDSFRDSEDWACLANLNKLDTLQISGKGIDDKGLKYLSNLKNLRFINIYCAGESSITDEGIKQLTGLPKLYRLMIKDGHFTDKSLDYLSGMPALLWLELTSDYAFSNKAMDNFQKKNSKVEHLILVP